MWYDNSWINVLRYNDLHFCIINIPEYDDRKLLLLQINVFEYYA